MKLNGFNVLMLATLVAIQACQEKMWRGFQILRSANGSARMGKNGKWVWTEGKPFICDTVQIKLNTKQASAMSLIMVIVGTITCLACHLYYTVAYLFYRLARDLW